MKITRIINILFREFPIYYFSRFFNILPNNVVVCYIRGFFVSWFLGKADRYFKIAQDSIINYPENIKIGRNVYIAHRIYINATMGLEIGDNVNIGPNVIIVTQNHRIDNGVVCGDGRGGLVRIGNGTWIGGNVTITPGVSIGSNCIIGAGAVVTKNIADNSVAVGIPAHVIK